MGFTTTNDGDNFPCQCHLSQYAYTDDMCPECVERIIGPEAVAKIREEVREEVRQASFGPEVRLAESNANPDEEPETLDTPSADDYSYFSSMTQEDWDADNDWLASAGWGEM